jgi:5-methylcytosine-specific restriction endonuclease McrA
MTKKCSKCGIEKDISSFEKRKDSKDGLRGSCKECKKKQPYYLSQKRKDGLKKYAQTHKAERNEALKIWREKNREALREYHRIYMNLRYHKDLEKSREYGKTLAENRNKNRPEYYSNYRKERYLKIKDTLKYKLMKKQSEFKRRSITNQTKIDADQLTKLIQDSNNTCFWCDCDIPKGELHLDHIYPLSKGGENIIYNLVVSCKTCNLKKHAKDPEQWLSQILNDVQPKEKDVVLRQPDNLRK